MKSRRPVAVALAAVLGVLVIVAIAAGGDDHHGGTTERAAAAEVLPTTSTTTTKPVVVAMAPCAVNGTVDPYLVVCGPASVKIGDRATFDLVARGHVRDDCGSPTVDWGDSSGNVVCAITCAAYPADEHDFERKLVHAYTDPGIYTLRFVLQACGPDPRPQAEITMELQVS